MGSQASKTIYHRPARRATTWPPSPPADWPPLHRHPHSKAQRVYAASGHRVGEELADSWISPDVLFVRYCRARIPGPNGLGLAVPGGRSEGRDRRETPRHPDAATHVTPAYT